MFGSFVIDEKRMWAVGSNDAVWYTDDGGDSWIARTCGVNGNLDDIWFVSDTLGFLAGKSGIWRSDFNAPKTPVAITPPEPLVRICPDEVVNVSSTQGFDRYKWSDGFEGATRTLSEPGRYILSAFNQRTCQESKDTIRIALKNDTRIDILAERTIICAGDSTLLRVVGPFVSVLWNTGSTDSTIYVSKTGTYSITAIDTAGCIQIATQDITVREPLSAEITSNRSLKICIGEVLTLSAPKGFAEYVWSNGEKTSSITTGVCWRIYCARNR